MHAHKGLKFLVNPLEWHHGILALLLQGLRKISQNDLQSYSMKLAPTHLRRYKDVAMLLFKHGRQNIFADDSIASPEISKEELEEATDLASDLEKLGPTFVKIGQLLSTRSDLIAPPYLEALGRLQDNVKPIPYEEIEKAFKEQLGIRISKAFATFDQTPIGSASLGQVHRATLRNGREVAVKIQRPGVRQEIVDDLDSLQQIAEFLDEHTEFGKKYETARVLGEFRVSLMRELDYLKEAHHLSELHRNLVEFPRLIIPEVVEDYTTSFVLTMDFLSGKKVTSLSGTVLTEVDGTVLADELFRAYLKQILVDGFFHADPHPGNLLLTPDHDLAILDLGMVGRVNQRTRDQLVHLIAGISHGDGVQVANAALGMGEIKNPNMDRPAFVNKIEDLVGEAKNTNLADLKIGAVILEVMRVCANSEVRIPAEISLLGKTLMNLDLVGETLSPRFDPNEAVRRNLEGIAQARFKDSFSLAGLMGALAETKDFVTNLPRRMNEIVELVATNKFRVKVDSIDEHKLMVGLQKVANRITTGLLLASFIIGSSMLARVETSFRIFGYPGLAMVFFLIAASGAIILMIQILFKDE